MGSLTSRWTALDHSVHMMLLCCLARLPSSLCSRGCCLSVPTKPQYIFYLALCSSSIVGLPFDIPLVHLLSCLYAYVVRISICFLSLPIFPAPVAVTISLLIISSFIPRFCICKSPPISTCSMYSSHYLGTQMFAMYIVICKPFTGSSNASISYKVYILRWLVAHLHIRLSQLSAFV